MTRVCADADKIWYLKRINLFEAMSPEEMEALARRTTMRAYRRRQVIYLPGQPGRLVYLLKKGVVRISRLTPEGRELILALLRPGEIFGELEALGEEGGGATQAEAHSDAMICVLTREDLMDLLRAKPDVGIRLSKIIGLRRRVIENRLENMIFRSVPQRLAVLFLELHRDFGEEREGETRISIPLTHEDIANLIGAARATVSETLSAFKDQGVLLSSGKRYILPDPSAMERIAAGRTA